MGKKYLFKTMSMIKRLFWRLKIWQIASNRKYRKFNITKNYTNDYYSEIVITLYNILLDRQPDQIGLKKYTSYLTKTNNDVLSVIKFIQKSDEYKTKDNIYHDIAKLYQKLLPKMLCNGNVNTIWNGPAIYFFHIRKTGGTTLQRLLAKSFHPLQIFPQGHARDFINYTNSQLANYRLFSTHMSYKSMQNLPHKNKKIITMLREPKSRILSNYYFCRAHIEPAYESDREIIRLCQTHSLSEILNISCHAQNYFDNHYVRALTDTFITSDNGHDPLHDNNPMKLVELAIQRISQFTAVGILEQYDLSIKFIMQKLAMPAPKEIKIHNSLNATIKENKNFSPVKKQLITEKIDTMLDKYTMYDRIIYQHAKNILQKTIRHVPNEPENVIS